MPIHSPGKPFRNHKILSKHKGKREVAAILSLTAMVDMFTVLVVFLLQNYNVTGQVIYIPKEVTLPKAEKIKELKPAVVVTISSKEILLDKTPMITYQDLAAQKDWMVQPLFTALTKALQDARFEYEKNLQKRLKDVVVGNKDKADPNEWNKVTVQADKGIDFLTVKKVMYTVTEAGAGEINFAVMKERTEPLPQ